MSEGVDDLILDLLEWLGTTPRPYAEVLEAWRTSCPRLPVWEEANERGFVVRLIIPERGSCVAATERGGEFLASQRPPASTASRGWEAPAAPLLLGGAGTSGSVD